MSWAEAVGYMRDFNKEHNITTKGDSDAPHITIVAVLSEESFDRPFSETERSYAFTNNNKAFLPGMISNSIFAECLDKSEYIKLSDYVPGHWVVERCYILEGDDRVV
jgi:hypothetical protein